MTTIHIIAGLIAVVAALAWGEWRAYTTRKRLKMSLVRVKPIACLTLDALSQERIAQLLKPGVEALQRDPQRIGTVPAVVESEAPLVDQDLDQGPNGGEQR